MARYSQENWNANKVALMEKCFIGFTELGLHRTGKGGATALLLAFLLSCGGVIVVTGAYGKRKKHSR